MVPPLQVPRRIKVVAPDTPFFSVKRAGVPGRGGDESSKVAAGMEVVFTVTFRPESSEHYAYNLIVCTEREKFVVPIVAAGAAPALDLPDLVEFGTTPARTETRQTLLVRNVGAGAASFSLRALAPFSVAPSHGFLAPGETLQLQLGFVPTGPRLFEGELEVSFDGGRGGSVFSQLTGRGSQLDVGLSQQLVNLLPTYVTKMSQRSFKVVNRSDVAVQFAVKANPGSDSDVALRTQRLGELSSSQAALLSGFTQAPGGGGGDEEYDMVSDDEDAILGDEAATATRRLKPLRRAAALDVQLFGTKSFQVVPAEGMVWPHSEVEVIVQFYPDYTREYEEVAYVEVQVRPPRGCVGMEAELVCAAWRVRSCWA